MLADLKKKKKIKNLPYIREEFSTRGRNQGKRGRHQLDLCEWQEKAAKATGQAGGCSGRLSQPCPWYPAPGTAAAHALLLPSAMSLPLSCSQQLSVCHQPVSHSCSQIPHLQLEKGSWLLREAGFKA